MDFSTAALFTRRFARLLLEKSLPADVDLLNLNVPAGATPDTPWKVTRLSRNRYFVPFLKPGKADEAVHIDSKVAFSADDPNDFESDVHALRVDKVVSITPLSLDLTSRVDLKALQASFGDLEK